MLYFTVLNCGVIKCFDDGVEVVAGGLFSVQILLRGISCFFRSEWVIVKGPVGWPVAAETSDEDGEGFIFHICDWE